MSKDLVLKNPEYLVNSQGVKYKEFRATLTPKYHLVWLHIVLAYFAFFAIAFLVTFILPNTGTLAALITIIFGGLLFGYALAYLQLFFHESAHYNLAINKQINDLLANIFIGLIVGQNIKEYRRIHVEHHRNFGTLNDTETTYFSPLNIKFIFESLLGIKILYVLRKRAKALRKESNVSAQSNFKKKSSPSFPLYKRQLFFGLILNGTIIAISFWSGAWSLGISWGLGLIVFFPFFAALRQVLEHRDEDADSSLNYHKVMHSAVNRLFGDGPISSTFGGAGFNRHLLHHWEPQISYTRLKDLEEYLMDTDAADILRQRKTTFAAFDFLRVPFAKTSQMFFILRRTSRS